MACQARIQYPGAVEPGIAGYLTAGGTVRFSSSLGSAAGTSDIGGLTGRGATVVNSYWDTQTSGQTASGGGEGRATAEMTHPYAANTYVDWDFGPIWSADTDGRNDGYPYLTSMPPAFVITAEADPTTGGGVSGAGLHPAWSIVTLEAAPAVGHHFVEWREKLKD